MERTWVALSLALLLVAVAGAPPADQQAQPALIQQGTQAQAQSQQSQQELNRRMLSHLQQLMVDLEHQVENSVPQEFSQQATTERVSRARTAAHATGMFPRQEQQPHALVESKAEQKTEQKTEQKVEQKVEQKAQEKIEQAKAEVMVETKAKTEAKTEAKAEAKTEAQAKTETKGKKDEEEGEEKKKEEKKAPAATGPLAGLPSVLTTLTGTPSISSLHSGLAQPVPDWLAPEVMERGTLQSNLHTAQEAISTSARLYAVYQQSLSALFTQARNYKPQVAQWIRRQKEKAAETVENVKSTLAALEPQLYTLENIIVDAKNKEAYYRRQANHLQVERQLQTSSPVEDAVKSAIMPQDKFEAALSKLQHLAAQAQKVREEAERSLAEKKNMIETGARWLRDSKGTLTAWLTRQAKHLRLVLLQARELAADWKVKLLHFSQVHTQATVLVKQYMLALQRVAAEEKIARLRAAYRARSRQDPDYANDEWEREDMRTKIANAQREVENLSRQMAWDSPPPPPAEWLSWLAADPNPVITAPLHMAPVSTDVLSAPIKFTPLKLTVPPEPAAPPAAINKMKAEKKEEASEEEGESLLSVASSVHANPAQMRFAQVDSAAAQPVIRAHPKDKVFAEDAKPLLDGFPGLHPTAFAKRDISVNAARGGRMPIPDAPPKVPEVKTLPPARDFVEQHFRNSPIGAAYVNIGKSRLGSMQKPPNLKPGTFHVKYMPSSFGRLPPEYIATASSGIDPKYAADLFHPILTPPSSFAYSPLNPANHSPFYNAHPAFARAPVFRMGVPPAYPALPPPPLPSAGTW